jgi:F420-dependent oxidoreductase-like protein
VRIALMTEPQQGLSYADILAVVQAAERSGIESYFRSDHYASFPGGSGQPTTDAWATLAGLARETTSITLGTLVSPVTFRLPGNFAKLVTTVDEMSDGRIEVGLGAGWNEDEHAQLGLPFPEIVERFDMLEEQLEILHGLWTEPDGWSFRGRHWTVESALFVPKPAARDGRRHPNLIVGGEGKPRSLRLAAKWADEYNVVSVSPSKATDVFEKLRAESRSAGRDPDEIVRSGMTGVLVADSERDLRDRVRAQLAMFGDSEQDGEEWLEKRRDRWIMGTLDQALERVRELESAGVQRLMLQDFLPRDLDMVRLIGEKLVPAA